MIENQGVSGGIPSELGNLKSLSALALGKCYNVKSKYNQSYEYLPISYHFAILLRIKLLSIWQGNNSLTGHIPSEHGGLSRLGAFDVGKNILVESLFVRNSIMISISKG